MTLAELSKRSGYSIGTINGLELHGEGSERLKQALTGIFEALGNKESVNTPRQESVTSGLELREESTEYRTEGEWKKEALQLREEVKRLKTALHVITAPSVPSPRPPREAKYKISSAESSAVEAALDAAEATERHPRSKPSHSS